MKIDLPDVEYSGCLSVFLIENVMTEIIFVAAQKNLIANHCSRARNFGDATGKK